MIKHILSFICIMLSLYVNGQNYSKTHQNNLKKIIDTQTGEERINSLINISSSYIFFQLDTAQLYIDSARKESIEIDYKWGFWMSRMIESKVAFFSNSNSLDEIKLIQGSCAQWFKRNGFEKEAVFCAIEWSKSLLYNEGKLASFKLSEKVLDEAQKKGDDGLIGLAWHQLSGIKMQLMKADDYVGSLDSAICYLDKAKDSLNLVLVTYKGIYNKNAGNISSNQLVIFDQYGQRWQNPEVLVRSFLYKGFKFAVSGNVDSTIAYTNQIEEITNRTGNEWLKIKGDNLKSLAYRQSHEFDKAITSYLYVAEKYQALGAYANEMIALYNVGQLYIFQDDYELAIHYLLEAKIVAENVGDEYMLNSIKRNLADLYVHTNAYEKAEVLYIEVIDWAEDVDENRFVRIMRGNAYNSFANLYRKQKDYEKAFINYQLSCEDLKGMNNRIIEPKTDLLSMYLDMKDTVKADSFYTALLIELSEVSLKKYDNYFLQKGRLMLLRENYPMAVNTLEDFIKESQVVKINKERKEAYYYLYQAYKGIGDNQKALNVFEKYKTLEDSLNASTVLENVTQIRADYEISLRENQIKSLQQENELTELRLNKQATQLEFRQLYISILIVVFLFTGVITYLLFRRFRLKKEKKELQLAAKGTRLELENIQTKQKVEIAEIKNVMFANISHEFRTPLTLIQVPIKTYLPKIPIDDRPIFNSILRNTDQLLEMIDELLGLEKMESNVVEIQTEAFNLDKLLSESKANFIPLFSEKKIQLVWENNLPEGLFIADESRLKIVLNNLLKNAFTHTPENGVVKFVSYAKESQIKLEVFNSGSLIPENEISYLFDRHFRGEENKDRGYGIGLSLVQQILSLHNGEITVKNKENEGVVFLCTIPGKVTESNISIQENNGAEILVNESFDTALNTILVVEDNMEVSMLLDQILKDKYNLLFAENGEEGIALATSKQPDIVLSDIMMPKKDGFELLSTLKNNIGTSHIPIILLTARVDAKSRMIGLDNDADDYVSKPFEPLILIARIENLLRQRKKLHKLFVENPLLLIKELKCSKRDTLFLEKARETVEKEFSNGSFGVVQLCQELALNRNSVYNKFKGLTNQSPSEFILNYRLGKAQKILLESNVSINQIYMEIGFNNSQAFNKAFKKKFNTTPSNYRKGIS